MKTFKSPSRALASVAKAAAVAAMIVPFVAGQSMAASVGVTWKGKSNTTNEVVEGFVKRMQELAPDVSVDVKGEQADDAAFAGVVASFDASKDAVVVMRSNGAKFLRDNPTTKPGFFGGVSDPVALGLSMEKPAGNLTGVTQTIPRSTSLQAFMTIMPSLSKATILLQKGHPSAASDRAGAEAACATLGLSCAFFEASTVEELVAKAGTVGGEGSALILGSQALIINSIEPIVAAAPKTPIFAFSERPIAQGATAGLVADLSKLGSNLADMVVDALKNGKSIKDIPIGVDQEPKLLLNMTSVQRVGLTIPPNVLNSATIVE